MIPKQGLVDGVGAEVQVAMPWAGGMSPLGASLLSKSPSPRLYAHVDCPPLAALGGEVELLHPIIRLW